MAGHGLYVLDVVGRSEVTAWRPGVPGIHEVFHARFTDHAYPAHTHDAWTLLLIDSGVVSYEMDRHEHGAQRSFVTLLPPDVPHNGRSVLPEGFRKRVLYLDRAVLDERLIGAAVNVPALHDPTLRLRVRQLHDALGPRTEDLEAQSRFALVTERLDQHLRHAVRAPRAVRDPSLARRLRDLLDARVPDGLSLAEASAELGAHQTHLVRAFSREYGMPPHLYLTGRRVDLARRHLLAGESAAQAAVLAGFYDQSHLTRHFRRTLGTTPAHYARAAR
ncbi:hypothetical protein KALB_4799 [Kutzneria albida DSM 43870]|uniref:HTH araC/xylS-type domain-containing protein n=1 Tax=Kutzneria albida DSM 43870 TaxID=1449976 RepID=W5WCC3_9PSEU|nr:hypothetical protein KALB_4799 [Kutzneria albida DSM 43870]